MSQAKRVRIPSFQQLQRWSVLINNMSQMESLESTLDQAGAPSEAEWDNFLKIVDQLESMVVNLSGDINTEVIKEDMSRLSIGVNNNKRKY
jgi:hypothetical protein